MTTKHSGDASATLTWVKSSHSTGEGPECVEVAAAEATVHVRDSKDPEGPRLAFSAAAWTSFVAFAVSEVLG